MKWLFLGITLKITSSLCKMKSKVTIRGKNTAHYTHLLYILLTMRYFIVDVVYFIDLQIVDKIFYFSDSWAEKYKNCKNFINLCHHQQDFNIDVEWIFFATSHGKSPCNHVMVLGDLLNVMLQNVIYKDPYIRCFFVCQLYLQYTLVGQYSDWSECTQMWLEDWISTPTWTWENFQMAIRCW